jgi:calreticulin
MKQVLLLFALLLVVIQAKVYFSETFEDGTMDRWTVSNFKQEEGQAGKWEVAHGQYFGDEAYDTGLKTTEDYRFYAISAPLDEDFSNEGKTLVVQYSVKHEQNIDCGGGYLKILPAGLDQENFGGDSEYNIIFGPDI